MNDIKAGLRRLLDLDPLSATVRGYTPDGKEATLTITNSSRRRIDHAVEVMIENGWVITEITNHGS